jgi:Tol biopolymer transport system component
MLGAAVGQATAAEDRNPTFSPGGRVIAFVRSEGGFGRIMVVRGDGHGLRFVSPRQPLPYGLTWSPDGSLIALSLSDTLVVRVDGSTVVS